MSQELERYSPNNWLDDNFWLDKAYLEWRSPLLINSNWWLAFQHDGNIPKQCLDGAYDNTKAPEGSRNVTAWQIRRAAWLLSRTLDFKAQFEP